MGKKPACAVVRDEKTGHQPYFVYIETPGSGAVGGALRFDWRDNADQVAACINRALAREGRQ